MYSGGVHKRLFLIMDVSFTHTAITKAAASAALLAFISSTPTFAESTADDIETLTVTGTRLPIELTKLPAAVSVLTESDIKASGALQLTELIRGLPGVSLSQSGSPGGLTEVRVRGSETNHLLVLIDGVIANDIGQGSLIDLAHLTAANVTRIELLKGPQSARWGSGAIGGVLSITTKAGQTQQPSKNVSMSASAGTQSTYKGSVNAASQHNDFGLNAYASYLQTDGDNISRVGNEDDGYNNLTAGLNVSFEASSEHLLNAYLRAVDYQNDYDATDFLSTGLPADSDNVTRGFQVSSKLKWEYQPRDSDYNSALTAQYRKDKNDNTASGDDVGGTTGERVEFNWTHFYRLDNWNVAAGAEYLQRLFSQRGPVVFGDPNQAQRDKTYSAFGEASGNLGDNVFTSLSARFDNNSEFDNASSYRAGLTWQVQNNVSVFTSYGKAVKTPTFTERFGFTPASFIGNADLMPEKSEEIEVGIKTRWETLSTQVSIYSTQLEDEINGFVFDPAAGAFTADNIDGESQRDGVDAEFNWRGEMVSVTGSYSYLNAQQDVDAVNTTELRRARHQGALTVSSDFGLDKFSFYTKLAYTGTRFDTFFPPFPAPSQTLALSAYTLTNVNVSYRISNEWQLSLKVNNLFDTEYEDIIGYVGQERRALVTVNYTP